MKKLFIMAAAASVTLASCVKNEPVQAPEMGEQIAFETPVLSPNTKAGVAEVPAGFDEDRDFAVWAHHTAAVWDAAKIATTAWMNNVTITKIGAEWKNATSYYWPKEGYLHFSAYSPSSVGATISAAGISIADYTVDEQNTQVDLMVSDRVTGKNGGSPVPVVFNHILSAINFTAKATKADGPDFVLTGLTVKNIKSTGDFAQGLGTTADSQMGTASAGDSKWSGHGDATDYIVTLGSNIALTSDAKYVHNGTTATENEATLILLPQVLAGATVVVNYTMEGVAQTTTFDIEGEWLRGYRYNYAISFGAEEITFTPSATAWTPEAPGQAGTIN